MLGVLVSALAVPSLSFAQTPIAAPVIGTVSPGDGSLTIEWTAPAGVTGITAYDLRHIETSADESVDANWTEVEEFWNSGSLYGVLSGLTNGTGYDVQVRAVSDTDGAWSSTSTGTPAEHGGTTATATDLTLGTPLGGSIDPGMDEDYFKLVLSSAETILIRTSGDLDTVGELQDGGGMELESNDYGGLPEGPHNFLVWRAAQAGTYYVKVSSSDEATGAYVLHAVSIQDTSSTSNAITVSPDSSTLALIDRVTDNDYFKLTLAQETDLIIRTTGPVSKTSIEILDNRQSRIAENRDGLLPPGDTHALVRQSLAAGTYFIKISGLGIGGSGRAYTLHIRTVREPGDTITEALPLAFHQAEGGNIDPESDADYFRIDVGETTHIRLRAVSETVDVDGALLDSTGQSLEANFYEETLLDGDVMAFTLRRTLDAGTYYVQVTRSGGAETGPYTIVMVDDPALEALLDKCSGLDTTVSDPLFGCQWNLKNTGQLGGTAGEDINVEAAWAGGNLGAGITVVIVDNDMDLLHEDLTTDKSRSHKYELPLGSSDQSHATDVAGIVAARDNNLGVRGVAPSATIIGHAGYIPPSLIGNPPAFPDALTRNMEVAAVYNMSLGIPAGAAPVKALQSWQTALQTGVTDGYGAKGVLYVVAAGNDALDGGNANLEEYQNSHHVTAVCAVNDLGRRTTYSEQGANLWVCAPSNDPNRDRAGIFTTTNHSAYTDRFGGTSAAAPTVSGVAALVRAANTSLTWRDVKLILAASARKNDATNTGWEQGALEYGSSTQRYDFNHEYGFGVVDASAAVTLASGWTNLPAYIEVTADSDGTAVAIPDLPLSGTAVPVERAVVVGPDVEFTEFVGINVEFVAVPSADDVRAFRELEFVLESPSGAVSVLAPAINDIAICGVGDPCGLERAFRFGSAKHLGEDPEGAWKLRITDRKTGSTPGTLESWSLTVYGHRSTPAAPGIDSVAAGSETLTVAWSPPDIVGASDITAYDLRYIETSADESVDANWTPVDDIWTSNSGGDLEYTRTGLSGDTQYDVQVRAVNTGGDGLWSETETGTPTTDEAPNIDSITPGDRSVTIEWTAPSNATLGTITSYGLRYIRSDAPDKADARWTSVPSIWTSGTLEYTLNPTATPLVNGVSYDVQVRALVGSVQHPWSGVRRATPHTIPGAPTVATVTGADRSLTVAWSEPTSDGGGEITSYDLQHIKTSEDEAEETNWAVQTGVWTSGDLAYDLTGLDTGTRYDVQVRAVNDAGAGAWSATNVGTTRPGAPVVGTVAGAKRGLTVEWSAAATDGDAPATSYDLRYIETGADETVEANWSVESPAWTSGDLTATVAGLKVGTQYDVQVRAENVSGEGPWSANRMGTTALSDDASLSALVLSEGRLGPSFSSGETSYNASVGYTVAGLTVTATPNNANTSIEFFDGGDRTLGTGTTVQVDLTVGANVIQVEVTAQDGVSTQTYIITVTRTGEDLSLTPPASDPAVPFASTASYTIRFRGTWTRAVTPDGLPGGAHFSRLIGGVHNADATFLLSGGQASPGVESMAEIGGTATLRSEVNDEINSLEPDALSVMEGSTDFIGATATRTRRNVTLTTEYPRVTLTTMIAPSHDWFVGVSGLPLLDASGRWLPSHEVDLFPWDAGTEEGEDFSLSPSVDTVPRGSITSIRGTGKFTTEPIASLTFSLQSVRTERKLDENTAEGVNIGTPVSATATSGSVSYALGGPDATSFDLDSSTGQLTTKSGVTYDHETKDSYTVTVTATDSEGSTATTVTITIADVNEAPTTPTGQADITVVENTSGNLARYSATDPDQGDTVMWDVSGTDADDFRIDSAGNLAFDGAPDYETPGDSGGDNVYEVNVDARDSEFTSSYAVAVTVTPVDEPPVITGDTTIDDYDENGTGDVAVYTASDPEGNTPITWSLAGPDRDDFTIVGGVLKFASSPDHERPSDSGGNNHYEVVVEATDSNNKKGTRHVDVIVQNVDEPPVIAGPDTVGDFPENSGTNRQVGRYTATDPEGAAVSLNLSSGGADFTLASNGVLTFNESPDYEDRSNYTATVRVVAGSHTVTRTVTVNIQNVEEPGTVSLSTVQPQEGTSLTATLEDDDGPTGTTWRWYRTSSRAGTGTAITTATSSSYTPVDDDVGSYLRVVASYDDGYGDDETASAVSANQVQEEPPTPEAPVFSGNGDYSRTIRENMQAGTNLGAPVTATDANNDRITYSIPASDNFEIVDSTGQLRTKARLDHEHEDEHSITVTATDPGGLTDTVSVTITVEDADETPEVSGPTTVDVDEGASGNVATYTATDPDNTGVSLELTGSDRGDFTLSGSGALTFNGLPDFETKSQYRVTIEAREQSPGTSVGRRAVTIHVTNMDEPGTVDVPVSEPRVGQPLRATVSDPDGGVSSIEWKWERREPGGDWTPIPGATSNTYTPTRDDSGSDLRVVAIYRDRHGPGKTYTHQFSQAVVLLPYFDADTATRTIGENTPVGRNVGGRFTARHPDNANLTYSLSGADARFFTVDPANGQLKTSNVPLDYEGLSDHEAEVEITATAPDNQTATATVTITVTNECTSAGEPPCAPSKPGITSASDTSLRVTWSAPRTPSGTSITGYDLRYRESDGSGSWLPQNVTGTNRSHIIDHLVQDTTYEVQVRATNDGSEYGEWSVSGTGTPGGAAPPPPGPPGGGAPPPPPPPLEDSPSVLITRSPGSGHVLVRPGSPISLIATFSSPVTGFTVDDIAVVNGMAGNLDGTGTVYTFQVTPTGIGEVTVEITEGVAEDAEGNGNAAASGFSLGLPYDDDGDNAIDRAEVIQAINDYLDGTGEITRAQVIGLINIYLDG